MRQHAMEAGKRSHLLMLGVRVSFGFSSNTFMTVPGPCLGQPTRYPFITCAFSSFRVTAAAAAAVVEATEAGG